MEKLVRFFKQKKFYRYSFIAAAILVSAAVVYAATVPYTFTSGTVAKSSEVNSNFSYLADRSWEKSGSNLYYSSGNVGIGTASPITKLDVRNGIYIGSAESMNSDDSALSLWAGSGSFPYGAIEFQRNNGSEMKISWKLSDNVSNTGVFAFQNWNLTDSHSDVMTLYPNGNVYVLGSLTQGSSRTLKENIKQLEAEKALSALKELVPVTYNYKTDKEQGHVGFIAEDVPAIVATKDRKGISPMDIAALLTKVVQEQQKTIAELKKEVDGLKKGRM